MADKIARLASTGDIMSAEPNEVMDVTKSADL